MELPQIRAMTRTRYRKIRTGAFGKGGHQPEVMGMDQIGSKAMNRALEVLPKTALVAFNLIRGQVLETYTFIGHDIAHPYHGKREIRTFEPHKGARIPGVPFDCRIIIGCDAGQKKICMPLPPGMFHHGTDINTAPRSFRALAEKVQDSHGRLLDPILYVLDTFILYTVPLSVNQAPGFS